MMSVYHSWIIVVNKPDRLPIFPKYIYLDKNIIFRENIQILSTNMKLVELNIKI